MWSTRTRIFPNPPLLTIDGSFSAISKAKKPQIINKLQPLQEVGLGYIGMGPKVQITLSGGKRSGWSLLLFLGKGGFTKSGESLILFIFDEPTTGLPLFHDIKKLLHSINGLCIDQGHFGDYHSSTILRWSNPQIGWWLGTRRRANRGGHLTFAELPRTGPKSRRNFTGEVFWVGRVVVIRKPSKGFKKSFGRVIIIPIGASSSDYCYPISNLWVWA